MKKEETILSKYSGYSEEELHERLTEPIIQPYDCFMAMIEFAEQKDNKQDATVSLLTDIISWEKDLSEYGSLETILRERYSITKKVVSDGD